MRHIIADCISTQTIRMVATTINNYIGNGAWNFYLYTWNSSQFRSLISFHCLPFHSLFLSLFEGGIKCIIWSTMVCAEIGESSPQIRVQIFLSHCEVNVLERTQRRRILTEYIEWSQWWLFIILVFRCHLLCPLEWQTERSARNRIKIQMLSAPMSERNIMGLSCTVPNWLSRHKCIVAVIVILMTNLLWLKSWKSRRARKKNAKKKRNKTWKKVTSHFCTQRTHNLFCVRVRVCVRVPFDHTAKGI